LRRGKKISLDSGGSTTQRALTPAEIFFPVVNRRLKKNQIKKILGSSKKELHTRVVHPEANCVE